jgi:DNA-directed RNA polymerase subunit RPC12/RpoP
MNCPWCEFVGDPRPLHAHLGADHPDAVHILVEDHRQTYSIQCPYCGDSYSQLIKPRGHDPGFLEEYGTQIRLVALDMLVNHLIAEHEEATA